MRIGHRLANLASFVLAGCPDFLIVTPVPMPAPFAVVATTRLGAVAGRNTDDCFVGSEWGYRDRDFDNWSRIAYQSSVNPSDIVTVESQGGGWTFVEAVAWQLGVSPDTSVQKLGNLAIAAGLSVTLPQVEEMRARTDHGEDTGMPTNGYATFFLVETGDPENPVSVGYLYRDGPWDARVSRLGNDHRWDADGRFLFRNVGTRTL